jgi:hypothetical protein
MRYLSLLAAILASTSVCAAADFTQKVKLRPGFAERWQSPRPFSQVHIGDSNVVDVVPSKSNSELIITARPEGGTTNIILIDGEGKQVANLLVTTATAGPRYELARSAETGELQLYRNDDACYPDCVRNNAPTKPTTKPQSEAPPRSPPEGGGGGGGG